MPNIIEKANNDGISWCECVEAIAAFPGQMDCPWCGCGWLFTCTTCRKAFTYGRIAETDDLMSFLREDMKNAGMVPSVKVVTERNNFLVRQLKPFKVGDEVIYLDGRFFSVDKAPARFEGLHAKHSLKELPHRARSSEVLTEILGDVAYWQERALPGS